MTAPLLATIDIGSNSILLLMGRMVDGHLQVHTQRKETVRLGGALDPDGQLHPDAIERGLECLRRYAGLMREIAPENRRAVATQTLREATNKDAFLIPASRILGCSVEVISGQREATLIYQGVGSFLPPSEEKRLIIDIGGRSTEICFGHGQNLEQAMSFPVGSVAWSQRFFADGSLQAINFETAENAAHAELSMAAQQLTHSSLDQVLGASGTAGAIGKVLHQMGQPAGEIQHTALQELRCQLIAARHIDRLPLQGLRDDVRPVIGGGVSIMCAAFQAFGLSKMHIAQGALRHGLLVELHQHAHTKINHPVASMHR